MPEGTGLSRRLEPRPLVEPHRLDLGGIDLQPDRAVRRHLRTPIEDRPEQGRPASGATACGGDPHPPEVLRALVRERSDHSVRRAVAPDDEEDRLPVALATGARPVGPIARRVRFLAGRSAPEREGVGRERQEPQPTQLARVLAPDPSDGRRHLASGAGRAAPRLRSRTTGGWGQTDSSISLTRSGPVSWSATSSSVSRWRSMSRSVWTTLTVHCSSGPVPLGMTPLLRQR